MSDDRLQEAKAYFTGKQPALLDLKIYIRYNNKRHTLNTSQLDFNPSDFVVDSLDASTDGVLANPLTAYLNGLLGELFFADCTRDTHSKFALQCGDVHYPLDVLYLSPELLMEKNTQHGQCTLVPLPKYFPFAALPSSNNDERMTGLKEHLVGKGFYFSGTLDRALEHLKASVDAEPKNALFLSRYSAALLKQGRTKEAIKMLQKANKLKPRFGKVYLRLGLMLYNSMSPKYEHALVTLHGGIKHGFHQTRQGGKAFMLARKCVVQLWGASAFQSSSVASRLPAGVLQIVFDNLSVFDVLRCAQVCFTYYTFATVESYWKRRTEEKFGRQKEAPYRNKWRALYRQKLAENSRHIYVVGICEREFIPFTEFGGYGNPIGFVVFREMSAKFRWSAFLRYLRHLGVNPAHFPALISKDEMRKTEQRAYELSVNLKKPEIMHFYRRIFTLAGACVNDHSKVEGECVLLRAGNLGSSFCTQCYLPTTNIDNKLPGGCIRGHNQHLIAVASLIEKDSWELNGVTEKAKKLMIRAYKDQEKLYGVGRIPRSERLHMYRCCGARFGGAPCCTKNHVPVSEWMMRSKIRQWIHVDEICTAHGVFMTHSQSIKRDKRIAINRLPVVSPLREFDPFCCPFEIMHMQLDDLKQKSNK